MRKIESLLRPLRISRRTWPQVHRLRAELSRDAPDAQLAVAIHTPAHEAATRHQCARVAFPGSSGDGSHT